MENSNQKKPFDSKEMEEWLEEFFLDPYTTYLDETVFRIDLYDSESAFIIEALLPFAKKEDIDILVSGNELQIKVKDNDTNNPQKSCIKTRTVFFPIKISNLKMEASFKNDILEIFILKDSLKDLG